MNFAGKLLGAAALLAAFASSASAATYTELSSNAGYTGPGLNLSAFANGNYNFQNGPTAVDSFTFIGAPGPSFGHPNGNSGNGSVIGQGGYGLGANGSFGGSAVYIGVDSNTGYDQLLGTTAYNEIGFFFNYAPNNGGDNATISALDAGGNVLFSFDLETDAPISTPGGFNQFAFRGIESSDVNIYGLRFGGDYILATGTANGNVPPPAVPEPLTLSLFGAGFAGMAALRRRKAKSA
jgi:hypothetical protein